MQSAFRHGGSDVSGRKTTLKERKGGEETSQLAVLIRVKGN